MLIVLTAGVLVPLFVFLYQTSKTFFNLKNLKNNDEHIQLMRNIESLRQSSFTSKFSLFLFDYFQSRNNYSINETIDIKIKTQKLSTDLSTKNKFSIMNNQSDCTNISLYKIIRWLIKIVIYL